MFVPDYSYTDCKVARVSCCRKHSPLSRATLTVKLHKAQGLPQGDVTYYVILKIMPGLHRSFQSKAVTGSSPEFKEQFEFYVAYENLQHQSLKFTVSSFDRFSQHEVVGELTVHLAELEQRGFNLSREVLLVRFIRAAHKVNYWACAHATRLGPGSVTSRLPGKVSLRSIPRSIRGWTKAGTDRAAEIEHRLGPVPRNLPASLFVNMKRILYQNARIAKLKTRPWLFFV